jgi:hypothetical protein
LQDLVFIDIGGVFGVHVQGNNNNLSTSIEFLFSIENSCLLNSKSFCFLYTEKVFCNNKCCCQAVLWGSAGPQPQVNIQNANVHGKSHGTNHEGELDSLHQTSFSLWSFIGSRVLATNSNSLWYEL